MQPDKDPDHGVMRVIFSFLLAIALVTTGILGFFSWYDSNGTATPAIHMALNG